MTCIIGLESKGKVFIGGDSAGTSSNMLQRSRNDKKVFVRDGFIFGFCGSFRMGQLIQHRLVIPKFKGGNLSTYMVNEFVDSVRSCLKEDNLQPDILVGHAGKLFGIHGDYQVAEAREGFDAMGSGADLAMGAMHSNGSIKNAEARIKQALEVSCINNAAVRPPFTILHV